MRNLLALALFGFFALGPAAKAASRDAEDRNYRAGLDLGLGIPTSGDAYGNTRAILGADFYVEHQNIDLGASYLTGGKRLPNGRRWRVNFAGAELNYKPPRVPSNFSVGASAGIVSFGGGDAFLPGIDAIYLGPKLGFLRMINRRFSWGLEGKLLFVTSSPLAAWIDLLGSVHYHF